MTERAGPLDRHGRSESGQLPAHGAQRPLRGQARSSWRWRASHVARPYVEMVWSELLGPTATLVARRIGHVLERPGHRRELSLTVIGNSLGVAPSKVRWSLSRLAQFELITISSDPDAVVTSGLVTPVPTRLLAKLSPGGLLEHRELLGSSAGQRLSKVWPSGCSGPAMRRPNGRAL
jgi:hypothetical protein